MAQNYVVYVYGQNYCIACTPFCCNTNIFNLRGYGDNQGSVFKCEKVPWERLKKNKGKQCFPLCINSQKTLILTNKQTVKKPTLNQQ